MADTNSNVLAELLAKLEERDAKALALVGELQVVREHMAKVQAELLETTARWEPPVEPFPDSVWAERRRRLNEVFLRERKVSGSKRVRIDDDDDGSIACSSLSWEKLQDIYGGHLRENDAEFPVSTVRSVRFAKMVEDLHVIDRTQGSIFGLSVSEERKKTSIHCVLNAVAATLSDFVRLTKEATIKSRALVPSGVADFMVERKKRRLLVAEAKKEDFDQGQAQDFVMMDIALAKKEEDQLPADEVYGVDTSYEKWLLDKELHAMLPSSSSSIRTRFEPDTFRSRRKTSFKRRRRSTHTESGKGSTGGSQRAVVSSSSACTFAMCSRTACSSPASARALASRSSSLASSSASTFEFVSAILVLALQGLFSIVAAAFLLRRFLSLLLLQVQ